MRILLASLMVLAISCGGNSSKKDSTCDGTEPLVRDNEVGDGRSLRHCTAANDGEVRCGDSMNSYIWTCSGCEWHYADCPVGQSGYPESCVQGCGPHSDQVCCFDDH